MQSKILIFLLGLMISGCVSEKNFFSQPKNQVSHSSNLPSWYLNPPSSTQNSFIGVGKGNTQNEAKSVALEQIAGEISVNISSTLNIEKIAKNGVGSKTIQQNIQSTIINIQLSNVKIVQSKFIDNQFYVYVKVSKMELFYKHKAEFDRKVNKLRNILNNFFQQNPILYLKAENEFKETLNQAYAKLGLLRILNHNFDLDKTIDFLNNLNLQYFNQKQSIKIFVDGETGYGNVIKKHLTGVTFVDNRTEANLIIQLELQHKKLDLTVSDPRLQGAFFVKTYITLKTIFHNKIIAQNQISVMNISKNSLEEAKHKTAKFNRKVQREGILNILLK